MDERDTLFARMARRPGTVAYDDYYARRPELQRIDDRLRSLPELLSPGGIHHDPEVAAEARAWFERIGSIRPAPARVRSLAERLRRAPSPSALLTKAARELGAVAAGIAPVDPAFVYTVKGRFDEDYGTPVTLHHHRAIVFLVEMDHEVMREAPRAPVLRESARQYYRAAVVARVLAAAIRAAGSDAKAHYDAHYDVILPPLAVAAGLGEMGRHNLLIAPHFGTRVRIGAVTTDLELPPGKPLSLGADRFCEVCLKCADHCPSRALSRGGKVEVRGVLKWPTKVERCYAFWRRAGTDCGLCMARCPFSHPDTPFHNFVRFLVRRFPVLHPLLRRLDDLVYGSAAPRPDSPRTRGPNRLG